MDKIWYHGVTRYLQKNGLTPKKIHADMVATLGDDPPALSTVKQAAEFEKGRESLEDDPRSGCPFMTTLQESIDHNHEMVIHNKQLTVNRIPNVMSISCK